MPTRHNTSEKIDSSRRKFLKASGTTAVALSIAGCSTDNPKDTENEGEQETTDDTPQKQTSEPDKVPKGGTFTYGMSTKPDSPNILLSGSVYSATPLSLVYEYGTELDPVTYEVKPSVYTDWTVENTDGDDPKPDVYFNVRDGLTWNDGTEFTKEDVQFTYDYLLENMPGEYAGTLEPIEKVESASNEWDFHMKLKSTISTWEIDQVGGLPLLPKHRWEGKDYKSYNPMDHGGPVGLGPGKLTKYNPDTSMQITFRDDYDVLSNLDWKQEHEQIIHGGPFLDKVNFKIYGGKSALTQAFLQGEVDTQYGSIDTSKIEQVKNTEGQGLVKGYDSGFSYFGFNTRRQPLDDVAFRQAMAFAFDDYYWRVELKSGYVITGDYAQSPGYAGVRPDSVYSDDLLTDPATNMFDFRGNDNGELETAAIRKFLTEGKVITGEGGTYAGKEVPPSLSGVKASQSEAKYDYTFGDVQSDVLKDHGSDKEIRVDGKTIPEVMDGDEIVLFIDPPKDTPKEAKAIERWVEYLRDIGIPISTQSLEFNTMAGKVYETEEFDIYPMGWGGTGPFGSSLWYFFHSANADDLSDGNEEEFVYNSTGYGLHGGSSDELLQSAREEMDPKKRNKLAAQSIEKIYLDMPYMLMSYDKMRWPMNTAKWSGYVENLVDPAYANWDTEAMNLHKKE